MDVFAFRLQTRRPHHYLPTARTGGRGELAGLGRPLPAARSNTPRGAHGLSRRSDATAEVTRPTFQCLLAKPKL